MVRTEQFTQHFRSKMKCAEILGLMSFWLAGLEKFSSFLYIFTNTKQWFSGRMIMKRNQAILPSILVKRTCSGLKWPFLLWIYFLYSQSMFHWTALGRGQWLFMVSINLISWASVLFGWCPWWTHPKMTPDPMSPAQSPPFEWLQDLGPASN